MHTFNRILSIFTLALILFNPLLIQASTGQLAHRDFWRPIYNVQRLDYCLADGKTCGMPVANRFCKLMGFERADQELIEYNVGRSNFLQKINLDCRGCKCNGFKVIRCVNAIRHKSVPLYYYRERKFILPHSHHCLIDWCLSKNKQCGKPVADSFCKRHGYIRAKSYKKKSHVPSTRTLGSEELCQGLECNGIEELTCYR